MPVHTVPDDEHRFGSGSGVWQHRCPLPPQVPHDPAAQIPKPPPQPCPAATQVEPLPQQLVMLLHALFSQQGWPSLPHAVQLAPEQTWPFPQLLPVATHSAPAQQPPA
jgi:hypothetical protein